MKNTTTPLENKGNLENEINENLTFEKAMAELETIVKTFEKGNYSLEEGVKFFKRGLFLKEFALNRLEKAREEMMVVCPEDEKK